MPKSIKKGSSTLIRRTAEQRRRALPEPSRSFSAGLTLKEARASPTLFSMKSSVMRRDGCSLKTEFIRAILAALRLASALVGQNWRTATLVLPPDGSKSRAAASAWAHLEAPEAAAPRKADVADVGGAAGGHHLVDHQGAVGQVGPSAQLHLPKLLQSFHHVNCSRREKERT